MVILLLAMCCLVTQRAKIMEQWNTGTAKEVRRQPKTKNEYKHQYTIHKVKRFDYGENTE